MEVAEQGHEHRKVSGAQEKTLGKITLSRNTVEQLRVCDTTCEV